MTTYHDSFDKAWGSLGPEWTTPKGDAIPLDFKPPTLGEAMTALSALAPCEAWARRVADAVDAELEARGITFGNANEHDLERVEDVRQPFHERVLQYVVDGEVVLIVDNKHRTIRRPGEQASD